MKRSLSILVKCVRNKHLDVLYMMLAVKKVMERTEHKSKLSTVLTDTNIYAP